MPLVERFRGFGGELVTGEGTRLDFDAAECLAAFVLTDMAGAAGIRSLSVVEHQRPDALLPAAAAMYLRSDATQSPMAMNLAAFATRESAERARRELGGEILDWEDVLDLVNAEWYQGKRR